MQPCVPALASHRWRSVIIHRCTRPAAALATSHGADSRLAFGRQRMGQDANFGLAGSWLTAFILSWVCLRLLLLPRARQWFLDLPNHRSLHANPIPRAGGIAIVPAALA